MNFEVDVCKKLNKINAVLEDLIHTDNHNIHTPFPLIAEILSNINAERGKKICVIHTFEFIPILIFVYKILPRDITFVTPCKNKAQLAKIVFKVNVVEKSALDWGTNMKFDIIMGNPPYQKENNQNGKLYPSFYLKSFDRLKDSGRIVFVTPSAWLKRDASIFRKMRKKMLESDIEYINLDSNKFFNVGESICSFIVKKSNNQILTQVILDNKEYHIDLNKTIELVLTKEDNLWKSINNKIRYHSDPKIEWREDVNNLQSKLIEQGIINKTKSETHRYPIYYTASQKQYANHLFGDKDQLKVLVNLSGHWHSKTTPWKYIRITRAMSGQGTLHISTDSKSEAKNIKSFLTSKLYHFWVSKTKTSGFNTGLSHLPMLNTSKFWTDNEIYKHFDLTQEEIDYIESSIK